MLFRDRDDAGRQLAARLERYKGDGVLVLAIPRGGVVVAAAIAAALGGELDVVITRKIGHPWNPEAAIGAVAPDGTLLMNPGPQPDPAYLERERERQWQEIRRRYAAYRGDRPLPAVQGRTVIVVDDGIATGATTTAALRWLRRMEPARLVLAVPVAPPDALPPLRKLVDDLVCLQAPPGFQAVGQFYRDFRQVEDEEVRAQLARQGGALGGC